MADLIMSLFALQSATCSLPLSSAALVISVSLGLRH